MAIILSVRFRSDIEPEFQQQLRVMVPRILDSCNLAMKEINGHKVTCRELVEYFKVEYSCRRGFPSSA